MSKFFNFWDPLERRYVFNSFLVVVALVEVLIFVVTLIWQIDEGMLGGPVRVVPFPWKEYLVVSLAAPIVLVFLFGIIVRGFQAMDPAGQESASAAAPAKKKIFRRRLGFFLGTPLFLAILGLIFFGGSLLAASSWVLKGLGLWGAYLLVALVAVACLYVTLRLILNYRLQKKALELRYLQYLAERHGVVINGSPTDKSALKPEPLTSSESVRFLESPEDFPEDPSA
jgi:ABC-type transport system involved in multi-copper enzyme maturation permease subunit